MRRALVLASMLLAAPLLDAQETATPEARALAGWDDETGIWFPPDAPREVYLSRSDPQHFLITDARKAFEADPALARAVAALLADPRHQGSYRRLPDATKQLVSMFHMLAAGYVAHEDEKAREDAAWRETERRYESWMDLAGARALPFEERRNRLDAVLAETREGTSDDRLRGAFAMLGLRPQSEFAMFHLLSADPWKGTLPEPKFQAFLRRVLEREAAEGMPESGLYRMAIRNLEFLRLELGPARARSRELAGLEELAPWRRDNVLFAAYLDRLAGDPAPLKAFVADCAARPTAGGAAPHDAPQAECDALLHSLSAHLVALAGEKAPHAIVDLMAEQIAARPTDWPGRLDAIRHAAVLDPARARAMAEELLQVPASIPPIGARLDAFALVGKTSAALKDWGRSQLAWDRYLAVLRYRPQPFPADGWARLTPIPEMEEGSRVEDAEGGWLDIAFALYRKADTAIAAHDFPLARRTIEAFVATAFAFVDSAAKPPAELSKLIDLEGLDAGERTQLTEMLEKSRASLAVTARDQLRLARLLLRDLGTAFVEEKRTDEARRLAAYLIAGPQGEGALPTSLIPLYYRAKETNQPITPAPSPWGAPPK